MGKITKSDIIDALYEKSKIERKDVRELVELFLKEIKTALVSYNMIELRGFGTFEVRIRKGRIRARNPKTGELSNVEPHGVAAFRAGRALKKDLWTIKLNNEVKDGQREIFNEGN